MGQPTDTAAVRFQRAQRRQIEWQPLSLDQILAEDHSVQLDRLCREQIPYQRLCGGVSVNSHTLADFRVEHEKFLNDLLRQCVAVLLHQGLIELTRVAARCHNSNCAPINRGASYLSSPAARRCET